MLMAGGSPPGASLVARTLDVLGAFDEAHRRLTITEIASRAGLSAPTALRIVHRLAAGDALVREEDGAYVVGRRIWDLGLLAPVETRLRDVAAPFLADLQAATRATVHLAIREDDRVLYVDRLSGVASVPVVSRVGTRLPMHATGVGKVLLAHAPKEVRAEVLGRELARLTAYTITSPRMLTGQLDRVVRDGYATTAEEMSLGACSVAVPVSAGGQVVAALGVVVPDFRRHRSRLLAGLQVAAAGIGRGLTRAGGTAG